MKYEVYADRHGRWRWRLKADSGKVVASSAEAYNEKASCFAGIAVIRRSCGMAEIVEKADPGFARETANP